MSIPIGIEIPYTDLQDRAGLIALAREAEDLGYDCIWCSEVYTYDAFTTLTQIACETSTIKVGTNIAQIYARTPALLATTAASLDQLSGGRFILGVGASGPQVIEGWHGVPYGKPLTRTREYVEIVRAILKREQPLEHHGEHYDIPTRGGSGLGKPLKLIIHPLRSHIPIYLAAIGPKQTPRPAPPVFAKRWTATPQFDCSFVEIG